MHAILVRSFDFEAAQSLPSFPEGHKCRRIHGHSFTLEVSIRGTVDAATGIVMDHARIAQVVEPLVKSLDHQYLNEIPGLELPSLENMCKWFWDRIVGELPELFEIKLVETPRAWCVYRGD